MNIIVTGGAGFIGSALIRHLINNTTYNILNIDKLTYAGNREFTDIELDKNRYTFLKIDICDSKLLCKAFDKFKPNLVMHLAAESHVDRSIESPAHFIRSNIIGTFELLEASRSYWNSLKNERRNNFLFHHISTDEVYGDLGKNLDLFSENTPYNPSSPYSASKASSDHLVRAWHRTYNLPVVLTNCSNNYGPFQHSEKLIPNSIINALSGQPIPIYGCGNQIRDWLFVEDHVRALCLVATKGKVGETYNIGGNNEKQNIQVVELICNILEELHPTKPKDVKYYKDLINFVEDRPGHDIRYAINSKKICDKLGWTPNETFETGLRKTIKWYLENIDWSDSINDNNF